MHMFFSRVSWLEYILVKGWHGNCSKYQVDSIKLSVGINHGDCGASGYPENRTKQCYEQTQNWSQNMKRNKMQAVNGMSDKTERISGGSLPQNERGSLILKTKDEYLQEIKDYQCAYKGKKASEFTSKQLEDILGTAEGLVELTREELESCCLSCKMKNEKFFHDQIKILRSALRRAKKREAQNLTAEGGVHV